MGRLQTTAGDWRRNANANVSGRCTKVPRKVAAECMALPLKLSYWHSTDTVLTDLQCFLDYKLLRNVKSIGCCAALFIKKMTQENGSCDVTKGNGTAPKSSIFTKTLHPSSKHMEEPTQQKKKREKKQRPSVFCGWINVLFSCRAMDFSGEN